MTEQTRTWDAGRYDDQFGFVSALATGVVDLLDPRPGEVVLDLGCGTGELALAIRDRGARVLAMDADPDMVRAAGERLGSPAILADGHDFAVEGRVDAVFSNAALHWMTDPEAVARNVRAALRDGGRFVGELGGAGNVGTVVGALRTALGELGMGEQLVVPWYFPSVGDYATLLERCGFRVASMQHFDRLTELTDCPDGVADWVTMFGSTMLEHVPPGSRPAVLARVGELCRPTLFREGRWYADYVRLRFVAVAVPGGGTDPGTA